MRSLRVVVVVSMAVLGVGSFALAQESAATEEQIQQTIDRQAAAPTFEEEITVTGSLIPRPSLDSLSPVTVMDIQQELTVTGTTRIEDLLVSLPQIYPDQNSTIANGATGTASINLRRLGVQRTLVLINGRRMALADWLAADINAVPAPMVKRVDVLTGGASTVYGSDAVAGVVNFIMDTDFTGVRGGVQYSTYHHDNNNALAQELNEAAGYDYPSGVTWDGGAIDAFVALGGKFADGRGHASAYVDYRNIEELTKASRDYLNCSVRAGRDGPFCGGSIYNQYGIFETYDADGNYTGFWTLNHSDFGGDGYSFIPWGGQFFNYNPTNHIQRPDEKWNAGAFAHYTINRHFEPYLEIMFMDNYSDAQIAPSANFGVYNFINCDNPMLSEQQWNIVCGPETGYGPDDLAYVWMGRRNVEGPPRISQLGYTDFRLVGGLRGDIDDSWSYDFYGLQAESKLQDAYVNDLSIERIGNALDVIEDPETGEWVCRSGGDDGCVPWNIFQEGAVTQEAVDYISTVAVSWGKARTRVLNLTFTGDLEHYGVMIPTASEGLQIAAGGEYRSEFLLWRPDEVYIAAGAGFPGGAVPISGGFDVRELFIEGLAPIVQDTRGFRDLSLELGYRYSDYSTSGGFNTYKGLINWAITDSWRLRGGYNRAVRAPNIVELFTPLGSYIGVGDICENDPDTGVPEGTLEQCLRTGVTEEQYGNIQRSPSGFINAVYGGNPLLEPEVADTITAGVVWTPRAVPGLSVTVDYFDIEITEAIESRWAAFIIQFCAETGDPKLCNRIHRDEVGSLWRSRDGYVDETHMNIGLLRTEGVDLNINYLIGLGRAGYLATDLIGTYLMEQRQADPGFDFDCLGYYGGLCDQFNPEWRHRLRATWESNFNLDLSLTWRRIGFSEIAYASSDSDLSDPDELELARANRTDTTPAYDWFDLAASYTWRSGIQLTLGVNNIFDEEPPFMPDLQDAAGIWFNLYGNYDPLGRYVFASLQFNF